MGDTVINRVSVIYVSPLSAVDRKRHIREMTDLQFQSVVETLRWVSVHNYDVLSNPNASASHVDHARGGIMWANQVLTQLLEDRTNLKNEEISLE